MKKFVHNNDESPRMFESDFLDLFSRVHHMVPLYIFLPAIAIFSYISLFTYALPIGLFLLLFLGGAISWTIAEYSIHRFIFHYEPNSKIGKRFHFIFHGVHHNFPNDSKRLVMVPAVSVPLGIISYFLFFWIAGATYAAPLFTGFVSGYLFYDMLHYAVHHRNYKNKYFQKMKKHHLRHHYQDPDKGYGFTSDVWDRVLHTNFSKAAKD